jgi:hypothetical protein
MRRSRLYLTLSIVSLLVAIGIGVAQKRCGYFKHQRSCSIRHDNRNADVTAARNTDSAVWDAFYARDFADMAAQATVLHDREDPVEGMRLRAYALRGQRRYAEAEATYTETMAQVLDSPAQVSQDSFSPKYGTWKRMSIRCEALIGRAICRHQLRKTAGAKEDMDAALKLARILARDWRSESDHYMLACAYAVQAEMLHGEDANKARLKAIGQFQQAIELGFDSWEHARADLDLDSLRTEPAFLALFPIR